MEETVVIVITTIASEQYADRLAHSIVDAGLAACVQIQPIRSIYRWKGEVCAEPEYRLSIKTLDRQYSDLEQFIRENHSYETPEIIKIPVAGGSQAYLSWIGDSVGKH